MTLHSDRLRGAAMKGVDPHAILEDDPVQHVGNLLVASQAVPAFGEKMGSGINFIKFGAELQPPVYRLG